MDDPADVSYTEMCAVIGELYLKLRVALKDIQEMQETLDEQGEETDGTD